MIVTKEESAGTVTNRSTEHRRTHDFLLTLPFILFFLVQLYHHELWRDEMNVWSMALASPTLSTLAHYIHYEGHPGLWYYLLWFPTRIWAYPGFMKWVEAAIGIAIYLFIGMASPWLRLEKVMFFCSYYISFEYTVLSRTYSLCLLIALLYIYMRTHRPQSALLCGLLLGLVANTDFLGVMLSGALLVEYAWYLTTEKGRCKINSEATTSIVTACSIYLVLLALCYLTLRPAKDISWSTTGHAFSHLTDGYHLLLSVVSNLGVAWFPLNPHFPHRFWNPGALYHPVLFSVISVFATTDLYFVFRNSARLLTMVALTMASSILFAHLIYLGYMRHFGIVFLAFMLAYWLKRTQDPKVSRAALLLLVVSGVGGAEAAIGQWTHPFSNAGNAAHWLVANHLDNEPLVGYEDMMAVGVAEQLNRPMYFPQCHCTERFMLFSHRRDDMNGSLPQNLQRVDSDLNTDHYILIDNHPLTDEDVREVQSDHQQINPLAEFTKADELLENFYLYRVVRRK